MQTSMASSPHFPRVFILSLTKRKSAERAVILLAVPSDKQHLCVTILGSIYWQICASVLKEILQMKLSLRLCSLQALCTSAINQECCFLL